MPQRLLREVLVPVPPMALQKNFAAYHQLHERYQEGKATHDELAALVARLERVLEGGEDGASLH